MSVYILEINSVEKPLRVGSLSLNTVVNGRHVLSCAVLSEEGAYRPTVAQTAVLKEDGTPVFGGIIRLVEEEGADGLPIDHISSRITCDSFNVLAERRFVTDTIPAGSTLKQALQILDDYLTDYGVTLDAGQANGPTLDGEQNIYGQVLNSVLDTLSQRTGWIWEIDASKTFRMFEPGTEACPINIIDDDGNHTGDIKVERSRDQYVNRVVLKGGKAVQVDKTDTFTGDGAEDTFVLTYPLVYQPQVGYGYVTNGATNYETLDLIGIGSGATWEYDPATNSITRVAGAPANLNAISITYPAQFPIFVTVEDASEIALNGIYEAVFEYPDVYDKPVLEELGAALLSQGLEIKTEVTVQTRAPGVLPGQSLTITAADRAIDGEFLITEVNARTEATTDTILRTLKCVEGEVFRGSFRGLIKAWLGGGTTSSVSLGPPASSGGGTGGVLVGLQRFTTPGAYSYTASTGTTFIILELQGAGGGGSGIASPGASKVSIGRSGGGGGWLRKKITADFDGATGSVGAGGPGGTAGDNAGTAGGDTTFTTTAPSSVTYTAGGGAAGNAGGSGIATFPNLSNGVGGGAATTGDDNIEGGGSFAGVVATSLIANSGGGGYSHYSHGAYGTLMFSLNASNAAVNATGKGGGGGSAVANGSGAAKAGGNGSDGLVIVWEYR